MLPGCRVLLDLEDGGSGRLCVVGVARIGGADGARTVCAAAASTAAASDSANEQGDRQQTNKRVSATARPGDEAQAEGEQQQAENGNPHGNGRDSRGPWIARWWIQRRDGHVRERGGAIRRRIRIRVKGRGSAGGCSDTGAVVRERHASGRANSAALCADEGGKGDGLSGHDGGEAAGDRSVGRSLSQGDRKGIAVGVRDEIFVTGVCGGELVGANVQVDRLILDKPLVVQAGGVGRCTVVQEVVLRAAVGEQRDRAGGARIRRLGAGIAETAASIVAGHHDFENVSCRAV